MKQRWIVWVGVFLLGVIPATAQGYTPIFTERDCPFPALERVTCGTLVVPENREAPSAGNVELAVAIISAANGQTDRTPVIYLEGGPGGSAVLAVEDFLAHDVAQTNDLILIDQRGTGFSQPSLNCYEMEEGDEDGLSACYDRLTSEGIDLSAYNSTTNAADINDLRLTLGYDQVNLWGISYGTRLGLTILRNHPEGVRAVALDSVFPPEVKAVEQVAVDGQNAFNTFFAACEADPTCAEAYPGLQDTFYEMVIRFNEDPPIFEYEDIDESYELELYGDDLLNAMFQTLYNSEAIPMLPYGITLLNEAQDDFDYTEGYDILSGYYTLASWEGEFEDFPETVMESDQVVAYLEEVGDISDSEGMFTSVNCAEEVALDNLDVALDATDMLPDALFGWALDTVEGEFATCETWAVTPSDPIEATRVQSDVPTLLISGGLDPVTPPSYADSALQGLPNGRHIVFPVGGHSETGLAGCGGSLVAAFFADPSAELDTQCIPQQIDWYTD